jgi:mevalonate pyrophosphate decarboxylase
MFSTSQDILFLTIAVCVAFFTLFSCWGLFYMMSAIRNVYKITKDFKDIFKKIEETIDALKSKIHESASYLVLFGEVMKKVMDVAHTFGERHREKREAEENFREKDASDIKKSKPRKIKVK